MLREAAGFLRSHDPRAQDHDEVKAPGSSFWSWLGQALAMCSPESRYVPPVPESTYEGELFEIENRLMREIVADHAAVIVGHGAAQMLRGRPGVLSVFLHAPEPWRIARVQEIYHLDQRAARHMVHESDRDRARFVQALSGASWTDRRGYDLAVDTAAIGFEAAIDLIVQAVRARTSDS
jgi:hypothetical protein